MSNQIEEVIKRCQASPIFFIKNFCTVKHQKAGIIPFEMFSYQKKSIKKFLQHRFVIYRKTRQCFAGSSRVWTPIGPKRIDELKVGDLIYTIGSGVVQIVPIKKVHNNGKASCVEVRTKSGHRSIATADHQFLTRRGWVEAGNLTNDDVIIEIFEPQRYSKNVKKSEAIILGYLLTNGHCGKRQVHFTNTRWKYLLEFQKHFSIMFGKVPVLTKHSTSGFGTTNAFRVYSYSPECRDWLKNHEILGLTKDKKHIPEDVFSWDNESIALLINRMFAADGWYASGSGGTNEAGIGSISVTMLHQLKQLLSRFGINSKIYERNSPIPKLRIIGGKDFEKFVTEIGIFGKEPRNKITKGFIFNRIKGQVKKVNNLPDEYDVYDLEVPPNHNYIVDGAVVHNCGISTLTGAFALWYGMFFEHKTILIVSKRDEDAKEFLKKNVKLVYDNLPVWMRQLWGDPPPIYNEHQVSWKNGSSIKSLTCHPDTLRSNASSLNIIDESAFIWCMDRMWAGGASTIMSGGSVIVISTPCGVGNWYHSTFMDAIEKKNDFHPIEVDWWDMDWALEYRDELTGGMVRIAPKDGIRKCETDEDITKWGPWYSPWLEEQYRLLQERGEAHKFRQEVLSEFIGSGNTVLPRDQLENLKTALSRDYKTVKMVNYKHPNTGMEFELDFQDQLWIWKPPVKPIPPMIEHGRIVVPEKPGHVYVLGADIASGEADDFSSIEVIDCNLREQVAELNIKCLPSVLVMMIDYLARWYNGAFVVPERTGIGTTVCQDLQHQIGYSNLFRMRAAGGKLSKKVGFPTSDNHKPDLNRAMMDFIGQEDGIVVYSERLYNQFLIYVHFGNRRTGHVAGPGNHSDLVIAAGLALYGMADAIQGIPQSLVPTRSDQLEQSDTPILNPRQQMEDLIMIGGMGALLPLITSPTSNPVLTPDQELAKFTNQLGGIPMGTQQANLLQFVKKRRNVIQYPQRGN